MSEQRPPFARPAGPARLACIGAVVLCLGTAAGCGEINGNEAPFAGTARYQDPAGRFDLRLLVPPWLPTSLGQVTSFVVPPDSGSTRAEDALYGLDVTGVDGDAAAALGSATAGLAAQGLASARPIKTSSGASGVELSWQAGPAAFNREVYVGASAGRTFHLHFSARKAIGDDQMITQMILGFTPHTTLDAVEGAP
jgi:hypothetical protein